MNPLPSFCSPFLPASTSSCISAHSAASGRFDSYPSSLRWSQILLTQRSARHDGGVTGLFRAPLFADDMRAMMDAGARHTRYAACWPCRPAREQDGERAEAGGRQWWWQMEAAFAVAHQRGGAAWCARARRAMLATEVMVPITVFLYSAVQLAAAGADTVERRAAAVRAGTPLWLR